MEAIGVSPERPAVELVSWEDRQGPPAGFDFAEGDLVMPAIGSRIDYEQASLSESEVAADPFAQFRTWYDQAVALGLAEPNAMTVATATREGRPSARVVLMRGFDDRGFTFFTNYESRKGAELGANPFASCVFFWQAMERQVRVDGAVVRVEEAESEEYFAGRPRMSKLGAWVSHQSGVVPGREVLEREMEVLQAKYPGDEVPRPPHWGGFRVVPEAVEFWQGRRSRLHDRIIYRREARAPWKIERLSP